MLAGIRESSRNAWRHKAGSRQADKEAYEPYIPFIGIEGAWDQYSLSDVTHLPTKQVREFVGEELVKSGILIGAEYATILSEKKVHLYGLEEKKLFHKNFSSFYELSNKYKEVHAFISLLEKQCQQLGNNIYNASLLPWYHNLCCCL